MIKNCWKPISNINSTFTVKTGVPGYTTHTLHNHVSAHLWDGVDRGVRCPFSSEVLQCAALADVVHPRPGVHLTFVQVEELAFSVLHVALPGALVAIVIGCIRCMQCGSHMNSKCRLLRSDRVIYFNAIVTIHACMANYMYIPLYTGQGLCCQEC